MISNVEKMDEMIIKEQRIGLGVCESRFEVYLDGLSTL